MCDSDDVGDVFTDCGTGESALVRSGCNDIFKVAGTEYEVFTQAKPPATDVRVMGLARDVSRSGGRFTTGVAFPVQLASPRRGKTGKPKCGCKSPADYVCFAETTSDWAAACVMKLYSGGSQHIS